MLFPRHRRRALCGAQLRRGRRGRRRRRSLLRIHDRRHRRGARQDRAQLRGRHVRRRRLCAGRGRRLPKALQHGDGRARTRVVGRDDQREYLPPVGRSRSAWQGRRVPGPARFRCRAAAYPDHAPRQADGLQARRRYSRELEDLAAEIPQSDAGGVPPRAEGTEGKRRRRTEDRDRGLEYQASFRGAREREPGISQSNI